MHNKRRYVPFTHILSSSMKYAPNKVLYSHHGVPCIQILLHQKLSQKHTDHIPKRTHTVPANAHTRYQQTHTRYQQTHTRYQQTHTHGTNKRTHTVPANAHTVPANAHTRTHGQRTRIHQVVWSRKPSSNALQRTPIMPTKNVEFATLIPTEASFPSQ